MFGTRIQTFSSIDRCRLTCADLDWNKQLGISVSVNADIALLKAISHVSLMKLNSGLTLPFYWRQRRVSLVWRVMKIILSRPQESWWQTGEVLGWFFTIVTVGWCLIPAKSVQTVYIAWVFFIGSSLGDGLLTVRPALQAVIKLQPCTACNVLA